MANSNQSRYLWLSLSGVLFLVTIQATCRRLLRQPISLAFQWETIG